MSSLLFLELLFAATTTNDGIYGDGDNSYFYSHMCNGGFKTSIKKPLEQPAIILFAVVGTTWHSSSNDHHDPGKYDSYTIHCEGEIMSLTHVFPNVERI